MPLLSLLFFSTDAPPTEIYTLSLHDALPISPAPHRRDGTARMQIDRRVFELYDEYCHGRIDRRSEEHTSELQSPYDLVCRLLLEKKKNTNSSRRRANRPQQSTDTRTATVPLQ